MTSPTRLTLAPLALLGLLWAGALAAEPRALEYDDVFELEAVSDPRPDPAGERIVFVRNWMDRNRDRRRSTLWLTDPDGDDLQPLTDKDVDASSPRWSPDGKRLAYRADGQIHMLWLDSGRDVRISELPESAGQIEWSPDGRWLAFVMFTERERPSPVTLPGRPEGADWAAPPIYIDRPVYRADGRGYLPEGNRQVYLIPSEGGSAIQLTDGEHDHGDIAWHPDGSALYLTANRRDDAHRRPLEADIYRLEIESRELERINPEAGPHRSPRVSPDGRYLAWLGFEDRKLSHQANRLHVMPIDGGEVTNLTEDLDRDIAAFQWLSDSDGLLIQYDHHGAPHLARQARDGAREVLTDRLGGTYFSRPYARGDFHASGSGLIAYTRAHTDRPAELAVIDGNRHATLTDLNRDLLVKRDIGPVEEFWYTASTDGRDIQGWIIYPPGFDSEQTYPLILEIHGGPFATYGPMFAMELQLMAAQGYVVVYTNPRGSTSYGEDFANLIHHNYPSEDFDDLMDGVDAVIERGYINTDELFITGGSGGGVLTTWAIAHTDRFAAAAAVNPVINWYSFVLNADLYNLFTRYWFPGPPWEHPEHYLAHSPISHVGRVETPTLLLTGEADHRTPISETEQYYQALQLRGIDTAMVRIPDASHGLHIRPSNLMAKPAWVVDWFERYRGEAEP